jgi:hypothetical protein
MTTDRSDRAALVNVDGVEVELTAERAWLLRREGVAVELALGEAEERALQAVYERLEDELQALPVVPAPPGWREAFLASLEDD